MSGPVEHMAGTVSALLDALRYVIKVRGVECLHPQPGHDEFCARCQANAAIAKATGGDL